MMHPTRRRTLALAAAGCLPPLWRHAAAQDPFPTRPVRFVVPFAAGASLDAVARLVGRGLEARWGQPVVVENRTGAGGNIGAQAVASAPPDGHTLLVGTAGLITVNPHIYRDLTFDIARDLAPVAMLGLLPNVMVVPAAHPARDVAGFVAWARGAGRPVLYGSPGTGSYVHVTGALFAQATGLPAEHVAYRGSAPALTDLVAGRLDVMFDNMPATLPFLRDGRLRALAVTSGARAGELPDVPTTAEAGLPAVRAVPWFALFAPGGTPAALRARIADAANEVLATPATAQALAAMGLSGEPMGPDALGALVAQERARLGEVVRAAQIRVE